MTPAGDEAEGALSSRWERTKILYLCKDPGIDVAGKSGAAIHTSVWQYAR